MPKYRIESPRFIKQVGEDDPRYINASPRHPAIVELDESVRVDAGLIPVDRAQVKPRPHYAERGNVMGKLPPEQAGKRLADR